jgi:hypothetical protein
MISKFLDDLGRLCVLILVCREHTCLKPFASHLLCPGDRLETFAHQRGAIFRYNDLPDWGRVWRDPDLLKSSVKLFFHCMSRDAAKLRINRS